MFFAALLSVLTLTSPATATAVTTATLQGFRVLSTVMTVYDSAPSVVAASRTIIFDVDVAVTCLDTALCAASAIAMSATNITFVAPAAAYLALAVRAAETPCATVASGATSITISSWYVLTSCTT